MPDQVRHDGDVEGFHDALAAFRQAEAAVQAVEAATAGRSAAEEEAWLPRHDAACEAMEAALARAMGAPAPDLGAFAVKLELLLAHELEPGAVSDVSLGAIRADVARLLG